MRTYLHSWLRRAMGVLAGALTAVPGLVFSAAAGLWLLVAPGRGRDRRTGEDQVLRGAALLARVERRRMARWYGTDPGPVEPGRPALAYVAARCGTGLLGGLVLLCGVIGAAYGSLLLWGWFVIDLDRWSFSLVASAFGGFFLLFLCAQGVYGVALMEERLARHFLGPSDRARMERRIGELAASRAGVVEAVHDERRRIERDLHDGVQQRLVALGMLLGRARRAPDPDKSALLLRQAHEEAQRALGELRDVAWRVYPAALDEGGLAAALETVAERAGIPVRLECALRDTPPSAAQSVAYFVAAEAVTNAVKHSGATQVSVLVERRDDVLRLCVEDDGRGGADPGGGGLLGLSRRVAALDGTLSVSSPAGGPTAITAELPCAS
ncbi:sensor histidine kinase [Streptomyces sp. NPDC059009]|uniref:sensor histidine kinase n=1 Tax=Streptomyces sp. NPDC059009 TaxID=3346694 RepID=UPI0036AE4FB1